MPQAILPGMFRRLLSLLTIPLCCTIPLEARVVRVEVSSRADVLNGQRFGEAGAYERIVGRVYFSLAVTNPHNRRIVDLDKAENLKDGEVEFSADFIAVRPNEENKGNGSMLLEIPNRGRGRIIGLVDGGDWDLSKELGDAWLLRNGYTIVTLGWQWTLRVPTPFASTLPWPRVTARLSKASFAATSCLGDRWRRFRLATLYGE
jgi:hypothetical protein